MRLTGPTSSATIFLPDFSGRGRSFPTYTRAEPPRGATVTPGLPSHPTVTAKATGARCAIVVLYRSSSFW